MNKDFNLNLTIVSIVAIVAIMGIVAVVLHSSSEPSLKKASSFSLEKDNVAGNAIKIFGRTACEACISDCYKIEGDARTRCVASCLNSYDSCI